MENEDGVIIACAFVLELMHSGVYHLDYFCVHPEYRGNGIGSKFFHGMADYFQSEGKYPLLTLESETKMIPYYIRQGCWNLSIQSDKYEEMTWYLLAKPLALEGDEVEMDWESVLTQMVLDLKKVLAMAAMEAAE